MPKPEIFTHRKEHARSSFHPPAASVFGEQRKLEPMAADRKARWKREVGWLLSVADHIVEFVAKKQVLDNGTEMEVRPATTSAFAIAIPRSILINTLFLLVVAGDGDAAETGPPGEHSSAAQTRHDASRKPRHACLDR